MWILHFFLYSSFITIRLNCNCPSSAGVYGRVTRPSWDSIPGRLIPFYVNPPDNVSLRSARDPIPQPHDRPQEDEQDDGDGDDPVDDPGQGALAQVGVHRNDALKGIAEHGVQLLVIGRHDEAPEDGDDKEEEMVQWQVELVFYKKVATRPESLYLPFKISIPAGNTPQR